MQRRSPPASPRGALLVALLWAAGPVAGVDPFERVGFQGVLEIDLEPAQRFYYPGQAVEVRANFRNPSGSFMSLAGDLFDFQRFKVLDSEGKPLKTVEGASVPVRPAEELPAELYPRRAIERTYRLSDRYPGLSRLGKYTVVWEHPSLKPRSVIVRVIRAYDPEREYVAEFRTSMGEFSVEFFPSVAPLNVKNFIDLANSGFYDSMQFHMVIPGVLVQAGDPKGDGTGYPGYRVPPEFSRVRHLKGTLSMWHHHTTVDSGSQFFICLSDQPQFDGHYTVIGQVREGIDVVGEIGKVPTTEDRGRMPFRPLQAVRIEQIRIRPR